MTLPKLSSLTPEQIRVMIAEACSFTRIYGCQSIITEVWVIAGGDRSRIHDCRTLETLPDYPRDLNAMAEAEKALTEEQDDHFTEWLIDVVDIDRKHINSAKDTSWEKRKTELKKLRSATATQRAHAFLLATGKAQP